MTSSVGAVEDRGPMSPHRGRLGLQRRSRSLDRQSVVLSPPTLAIGAAAQVKTPRAACLVPCGCRSSSPCAWRAAEIKGRTPARRADALEIVAWRAP